MTKMKNAAIRIAVDESIGAEMFPTTVTFESGAEARRLVRDLDDVWALALRHGIARRMVLFHGLSWKKIVR